MKREIIRTEERWEGQLVAQFQLYDYYGDKWHIGGTNADLPYLGSFIETLDKMILEVSSK